MKFIELGCNWQQCIYVQDLIEVSISGLQENHHPMTLATKLASPQQEDIAIKQWTEVQWVVNATAIFQLAISYLKTSQAMVKENTHGN